MTTYIIKYTNMRPPAHMKNKVEQELKDGQTAFEFDGKKYNLYSRGMYAIRNVSSAGDARSRFNQRMSRFFIKETTQKNAGHYDIVRAKAFKSFAKKSTRGDF